jgi:uncharacterized protein YwqG
VFSYNKFRQRKREDAPDRETPETMDFKLFMIETANKALLMLWKTCGKTIFFIEESIITLSGYA